MQFFDWQKSTALHLIAPSEGRKEQPMDAEETVRGASTRSKICQLHHDADYYVRWKGGVDELEDGPSNLCLCGSLAKDKQISVGRSAMLPLPNVVLSRPLTNKVKNSGPVHGPFVQITHNVKNKQGGAQ